MNDKKPKLSRFFGFDFSSKLIIDKKDKNIRKEIKMLCFSVKKRGTTTIQFYWHF